MRIALDTNILAYAEGLGEAIKHQSAVKLIDQFPQESIILPAQTLGELYRVLTGKANRKADDAREIILGWVDSFEVADSTWTSFQAALDLSVDHVLQFWDALILAVAAENRCRLLLSEDFQHGFTWRGVTVVNPFLLTPHPLLTRVLDQSS